MTTDEPDTSDIAPTGADEALATAESSDSNDVDTAQRSTVRELLLRHRWTGISIAAFAVVRTIVIAASGSPFRTPDSALFLKGSISLAGDAAQFWPVPLLMRLGGTDTGRMWLHHLLATIVWSALASGVAHTIRKAWLRHVTVAAVLAMGLAPQVVNWDPAMLGESLVTTLAVLVVAAWLWRDRGSLAIDAAMGLAALLLVCARPTTLPLAAVLVVWGSVGGLRRGAVRPRVAATLVVVLTGGGIAWMVATLDAHDEAYRQRGESGMSFGGEIAAGQLWDRMLADDDSFVWLTERGMPDPVDGIRPAPASASPAERAASWTAFLDAATSDPEWNQWLDSQGSSLAVEWALAQPVAALSGWADHSGSVLAGATGHSEGGNAVRGVLATIQPFFRGAGWTSDVALLFAAAALLVLFARRARENGEVHRADGGAAVAAAGFVTSAGAWLLTGIDYERHAVPGPLLLRIGLILMVATLVDSMAPRPGGETARRW